MNASPAQINPVNPVQAASSAGKSQESSSDKPFSQVLSSEIAQKHARNESSKTERTASESGEETASLNSGEPVESGGAGTAQADKAERTKIAAAFDMLRADALPGTPEPLFNLAVPAGQQTLVQTSAQAGLLSGRGSQEAALQSMLDAGPIDADADQSQKSKLGLAAQKPDTAQSGKTLSAAFAGQLAATRLAESSTNEEQRPDLLNNLIMRATPQVTAEAPTPLSGASANRLAPSVGTAAWGQALGEKIVWMAAGSQQTASLTLNPPNLGPMQIVLNISNDQATASFFSAQPEVRQALEAAFPRLREMMNEAGIQLGQATVSADTPQQNAQDQSPQRASRPFPGLDEAASNALPMDSGTVTASGRGLIDTFA